MLPLDGSNWRANRMSSTVRSLATNSPMFAVLAGTRSGSNGAALVMTGTSTMTLAKIVVVRMHGDESQMRATETARARSCSVSSTNHVLCTLHELRNNAVRCDGLAL